MKKRMHQNSLDAFDDIEEERSERAQVIYALLSRATHPMTDREIAAALGFTDMNMVRPRITELRDNRWLVEAGSTECPVTKKQVRRVRSLSADDRAALIARQRARFDASRAKPMAQLNLSFA